MPARAAARTGAARRSVRRKAIDVELAVPRSEPPAQNADLDDWVEAEADGERLEEGEMEILLTGHAASHGIEDEDNWLVDNEDVNWNER